MHSRDRRALQSRQERLAPHTRALLRYGSPQALARARAETQLRFARAEVLAALRALRHWQTLRAASAPDGAAIEGGATTLRRRLAAARAEHRKWRRWRDRLARGERP